VLPLDSCSTINHWQPITAQGHPQGVTSRPMHVWCNTGVHKTDMMETLRSEPAWFDPRATAYQSTESRNTMVSNITATMMMPSLTQTIMGESTNSNQLAVDCMHTIKMTTMAGWAFITLEEKKCGYTQWAVQSATLARKVQNIILHLSSHQYQKITSHNLLPNCLVNAADVSCG